MNLHPFNIRRRLIAHRYRKKQFDSVVSLADNYLKRRPNDLFVLELKARAYTSARNWNEAVKCYLEVHQRDQNYLDCSFQLARCAIYTKRWDILEELSKNAESIDFRNKIYAAFDKKLEPLSNDEFERLMSEFDFCGLLGESSFQRWVNLGNRHQLEKILPIDNYCMERNIGGPYLGYALLALNRRSNSETRVTIDKLVKSHSAEQLAIWLSKAMGEHPQEMKVIGEWLISHMNLDELKLQTIEALCVSEILPDSTELIVKRYIQRANPEEIPEIVQVIGKKTDVRRFLDQDLLTKLISEQISLSENPRAHKWMIEHCLRASDLELLGHMLKSNNRGIVKPLISTISNLRNNRFDERLANLVELIWEHKFYFEEITMRNEIARSLLEVADPITALIFAYECIQLEPQDAVAGLIMLDAAINSGSSEIILQAADIVLSMKYRSNKIDYASIAAAAVRENKIDYAKTLLRENRLSSDTRSQRIRIGIPFFVEGDSVKTLEEIDNTQTKHCDDLAIKIYKILALTNSGSSKEALDYCNSNISDETEKYLLQYIVNRTVNKNEQAIDALQKLAKIQNRPIVPVSFIENNFEFASLDIGDSSNRENSQATQPLISVIMTVHRWNDAFPIAVNSILNQSHNNLELIVVDDGSNREDVEKYDLILTDKRIVRLRLETNSGTYACRNRGIGIARGKYVTFADSDDWNHPDRLKDSAQMIEQRNVDAVMGRFLRMDMQGNIQFNGSKISQFCLVGIMIRKTIIEEYNLKFDSRARYSADSEFYERIVLILGRNRVHRHEKIDIIALHHNDSLTGGGENRIDWIGPRSNRLRYVADYRKAHKRIGSDHKFNFDDFQAPGEKALAPKANYAVSNLQNLFQLKERNTPNKNIAASDDSVTVFMATYSGGFRTVGKAVQSLLSQTRAVDKFILHVNGKEKPPNLPEDDRLEVVLSAINYADNGKFKHMTNHNGYFITADDDICYPNDYVETMISNLNKFANSVILGVHGAVFPVGPPLTRWSEYRELRRTHIFSKANAEFIQVNCIGTGTMIFHSQIGIPDFRKMDTLRMVDLHIAVWAQRQGIQMYSCPRPENWLSEFEIEQDTRIWAQANTQTELQWKMMETLNKVSIWSPLHQFPYELQNGLLSKFQDWRSRQIPISMELPQQKIWEDLTENPKVTIYIPAFNTADYIIRCVESALNQTYKNFEVSIQNGGTDDNSLDLLIEHYQENPKVIFSSKPTKLGEGTNIAIGQGSGELILQLDSDDILEPTALETLVTAIGKKNVCAYGNFQRIDSCGAIIDKGWEEAIYSRERLMRSMIIHHPRLFRRDAWEFVGKHDEDLKNAEDYDFFIKLSEVGDFVHVRKILYNYRVLENSASNFDSTLLTKNTHLVQRRMIDRNDLSYEIVMDNLEFPRRIRYRHVAFSGIDK